LAARIHRPIEIRAHEEARGAALHELLVAHHVDAVLEEDAGDDMDKTTSVIAFHQQHLGAHATPPESSRRMFAQSFASHIVCSS
jgi:hypothetical protein